MGFFRRNNISKPQEPPVEDAYSADLEVPEVDLIIEVQDINHELRRTPKKRPDQIYLKESPTDETIPDHDANEFEIDLATFREVVTEEEKLEVPQQEEPIKEDSGRGRRRIIVTMLALLLLLALILGLTLGLRDRDGTVVRVDGGIEKPLESNEAPPVEDGPEVAPEYIPDYATDDAVYLMEILKAYTSVAVLTDGATHQGQAFIELLRNEEVSIVRTPITSVTQRYALQMLYVSTSPDEWLNAAGWNTAEPDECSWNGVAGCTTSDNGIMAISKIVLESNNLIGTIPTELCILGNSLQQLNLAQNALEGGFPECLCRLESLLEFNAGGNQLGGSIPKCVVETATMASLSLEGNQMTGTIPPFGVTRLQNIDVRNNQLTGNLDGLFVAASRFDPIFASLQLDNNQFTGTIPDLSGMTTLSTFTATGNELSGEFSFCQPEFEQLEVDCLKVECACCTNC